MNFATLLYSQHPKFYDHVINEQETLRKDNILLVRKVCTFRWILDRVYHILISKDYTVLHVENHRNWVNVKPVK